MDRKKGQAPALFCLFMDLRKRVTPILIGRQVKIQRFIEQRDLDTELAAQKKG
jgi:hypothetical protein